MKIYLTTEDRKKLIKKGFKGVSFIQINKILDEFKITLEELRANKQYQYILNAEIEKRIKNYYAKGYEKVIYQIDNIFEETIWNFQDFFDRENLSCSLQLIDWEGKWKNIWDDFYVVISDEIIL